MNNIQYTPHKISFRSPMVEKQIIDLLGRTLVNPLYLLKNFLIACLLTLGFAHAQEGEMLPEASKFKDPKTKLWFNTYGNFRISKRLYWDAQTHFRFEETKNTPFVGQVGQLYNRHAIGYIYSKYVNFSLGGVLRINFNTDESSEDRNVVPEWRIWHQYQFAQPVYSAMFYHRIRIEHRWTQGFEENSEYIYRNRWRYMFRAKVPLNSHKLEPGTIYVSPEAELIMQSGKAVVGSVMEDLRFDYNFGVYSNPKIKNSRRTHVFPRTNFGKRRNL